MDGRLSLERAETQRTTGERGWVVAALCSVVLVIVLIYLFTTQTIKKDKRLIARGLVQGLSLALDTYRDTYGSYPWPQPGEVSPTTTIDPILVYRALTGGGASRPEGSTDLRIHEVRPCYVRKEMVTDGWGNPIRFRVSPSTYKAVVWSCGPDGEDDTNDGSSRDPKQPQSYYCWPKGDTGDDIVSGVDH